MLTVAPSCLQSPSLLSPALGDVACRQDCHEWVAITSRLSPRPTLSLQARPAEAQTSDQRGPCPSLWTRSTFSILSWACHFPAPKSPEARRWVLWTLLPARPPCLSYVSPACAPPGPWPLLAHHALPLSRSPSNVTPLPHLSVSIAGRGASGMWLSILFLARGPWKWRRVGPACRLQRRPLPIAGTNPFQTMFTF